ncbi:MAG TPA: AMP-binding protein [Candidatus Polarisedimenticolia bacterium]|jgi:crotonobetaine/carnitine-CoA ligase
MSGPAGLRAFLDERCAARGDAVFLWFRGQTWSYADLAAITDGAASAFCRLGLVRGDRVALLMPNGPEAVFTWLALAKLGAVTAPIHSQLTAPEVGAALSRLEPRALVVDETLSDRVSATPPGLRTIGPELQEILSSRDPLTGVDAPAPEDPADILMTSGTTGRPKGVVQSHRTFVLTGEAFAHWLGLTPEDRLFTCLPLSHVNARAYSTMGALASGGSLALEDRFSASRFWGWLADSAATQCNTIGAMLQIMLKAPPGAADRAHRVRLVYNAPALGQEAHLAFERRFGVRLVIGYGLSESTFGFVHPLQGERRLDSMGRLRSHPDQRFGNEARLVAEGRDVGPGQIGEIWLRNPATFSGYFRDEEATREVLTADGWLRTGDLARRDTGGWHTFVGRDKEIIRRRGENIAPAEVEAALESHPSVKEAAVVGAPSALGEEEVAAFVVLAPGANATEEELRAHAAARLAPFKVPSIWRFIDELPRTPTRRVARHLLRTQGG